MLYFNMPRLLKFKETIVQEFTKQLNWSSEQKQKETATLEQLILNSTHFT
jgi:hypothetical protein